MATIVQPKFLLGTHEIRENKPVEEDRGGILDHSPDRPDGWYGWLANRVSSTAGQANSATQRIDRVTVGAQGARYYRCESPILRGTWKKTCFFLETKGDANPDFPVTDRAVFKDNSRTDTHLVGTLPGYQERPRFGA